MHTSSLSIYIKIISYILMFIIGYITGKTAYANYMPQTNKTFSSQAVFVINPETQEKIVEKNSQVILPIASITKLMTAVIVLDSGQDLEETIEITDDEVDLTAGSTVSRKKILQKGMVFTRAELLHLALMNSQNRAAAALARSYPGGTIAFVQAMNEKAREWGLENTHFVEPTGLSGENVSTATDLAKLVYLASHYLLIGDFSVASSFETSIYFQNKTKTVKFGTTNAFIHKNEWNIRLQKTGYTKLAGRCVAMFVEINNSPYIFVLLNAPTPQQRAADAIKIKYWIENQHLPTTREINDLNPYKETVKQTIKRKQSKKRR